MTSITSRPSLPALPSVIKDNDNTQKIMHVLRHFHLGNPTAAEQLEALGDAFLPALLAAYRDASQLRYDYPLYLCPVDATHTLSLSIVKPLAEFLQERVETFAQAQGSARILKDNLPWIERSLREVTREIEGPTLIKPLLVDACQDLSQHLQLDNENQQRLQEDLDKLIETVHEEGQILGYGRFPALHLLMHLISNQVLPQLTRFKHETEQYIKSLQVLLDVDNTKLDDATSSKTLKSNISSNQFFNTETLSKVVKHSHGSVSMSASRRQRIEEALLVLQKFKEKETLIHIVHSSNVLDNSWLNKSSNFSSEYHEDPCLKATDIFDQEAQALAKVFAAARIAKLEIENAYDENIHDPWFNNFNWEAFSHKELILVPSVIVLEAAKRLVDESMVSFSHLLNSGRPVNIFVRVLAHDNPGARENEGPFQSYRTELGYLGISHRQAVVTQSSAARHQHLLTHFNTALNATRTSLHLINIGLRETGQDVGLNAWLVAGAALEGRAHPFFAVNPGAGDSAADRMDFEGNPQPEKDWPKHKFSFINEGGDSSEIDLDFTFADYALLIPRLHHHFALIPAECESDDLLPVAEYLSLPANETDNFVPFIWAVNQHNELRMLAVSRALIHACRDRLNFWRSLQEMAGVRSRYIEDAEKRIHAEADAAAAKQIAQAKTEFEAKLERVKTATAAEVMSRLTDILLGMDLSSGAVGFGAGSGAGSRTAMPSTMSSDATPQSDAELQENHSQENHSQEKNESKSAGTETIDEEEDSFDEPWIDTPLCTTCNDCLDINPLMFVYNDTNQAVIADLGSGNYLQMVEAAEICPSKCIHPGKPWDQSEAGLEELIQRAQPFN
jgi:ferredoxin/HPt (histidine-containing phosphotransfer) domain-containing protein